jgi:hypothetical protein
MYNVWWVASEKYILIVAPTQLYEHNKHESVTLSAK